MGEIGRSLHANDVRPFIKYKCTPEVSDFTVPLQCPDRRDRRLVIRPETGWPGHGTELSSLRYRSSGALDTHPPEEPRADRVRRR